MPQKTQKPSQKKKIAKKTSNKPSFAQQIITKLEDLDGFTCRGMFGCVGLYGEGVFFGIIWEDRLFFRVNSKTLKKYLDRNCVPFQFKERQRSNNYYEVPDSIIGNNTEILKWARDSIRFREK